MAERIDYRFELPVSVAERIDRARGDGESREEFVRRALELAEALETTVGRADATERRVQARPAAETTPVAVSLRADTVAWLERAQPSGGPAGDFIARLLQRVLQWRDQSEPASRPRSLASFANAAKSVLDDPSVRWAFRVGALDDSPTADLWAAVVRGEEPKSSLTKFVEIVVFPHEWKKPRG